MEHDEQKGERCSIQNESAVLCGPEGEYIIAITVKMVENQVKHGGWPRLDMLPAKTGKPKTSEKFAAQIAGRVKIISPRESTKKGDKQPVRLKIHVPAHLTK